MDTQLIPATTTYQDDLTAAERFEAYRYAAQPLCDAEPMCDRGAEDGQCSGWLVDDVMMARSTFTWTRFQRSARQARQGGGFLLECLQGQQVGEVDGHAFQLDADRIVLRDLSRPFRSEGYADEIIGVIIPRYRILNSDWLRRHAPVVTFPVATPGGQIPQPRGDHYHHARCGLAFDRPGPRLVQFRGAYVSWWGGYLLRRRSDF